MWTQRQNIKKVTEHAQKRHTDQLIIEKTSNIFLNDTFVYTGSHSATLEKEWAVGYLLVHDKINLDISSVSYTNNKIHVTASESSIKEQTHAAFLKPIPEIIFQLTSYFQEAAILYKKTATLAVFIHSLYRFKTLRYAELGIVTFPFPIAIIFFLPFFCFSRSFRFRVTSPP